MSGPRPLRLARAPWPWACTLAGAAALSFGCAAIEEGPPVHVASSFDALVSGNVDLGRASDARGVGPSDAGGQSAEAGPMDAGAQPCTPGQFVDFCSLCGADGVPVVPENGRDQQCPAVDCAALTRYETFTDDQDRPSCQVILRNPSGPNCAGLGTCIVEADDTICVDRPAVRVAVVEQPCTVIEGCVGATPGTVGPAPVGTPCMAGAGQCNAAGACDTRVTDLCGDFAAVGTVCGVGTDPGFGAWCSVAPMPGAATTCVDVCSFAGSSCGAAFRVGASACEPGVELGCIANDPNLICLCRQL